MNQEDVGIGEPSPTGTSGQERRWAILRWLSVKMHDAPHDEILEAAERFDKFVAAEVAGQKLSKEAISKIEGIESTAGKIVAVEAGSDFVE